MYDVTMTIMEVSMTLFIALAAMVVVAAMIIEAETGMPARIAIEQWWNTF